MSSATAAAQNNAHQLKLERNVSREWSRSEAQKGVEILLWHGHAT
jgi:hypothetical protein